MIKRDLSQGGKDFSVSVSVIHHINKLTNNNHMTISIYIEKAFDKIQHSFMIKILWKVDIEGTYLNILKAIFNKAAANIIPHGAKLVCPQFYVSGIVISILQIRKLRHKGALKDMQLVSMKLGVTLIADAQQIP